MSERSVPRRPEVLKIVRRQRRISQNPTANEEREGFRGWKERGYFPHRDEPDLTQFVTFRLADSFPEALREKWEKLLRIEEDRERRTQLEAWLDLGHGECHLNDDRIARVVVDALQELDGVRYRLLAFTIMPNHVHVLFHVSAVPMKKIVQGWKGRTSRAANQMLGKTGHPFWQHDYWDTYMRDPAHEAQTTRYIRNNPVKASLVSDWRRWPWTCTASDE